MQVNTNNFFRWYTDTVNDTSVNIPRLGLMDSKRYLPCLVSGETTGFYINADVPFLDADDVSTLRLNIVDGFGNTKATIGYVLTKVVLATGYRLYASFSVPTLPAGEYQYSILNTSTSAVKLISNFFRIISAGDANLYTVAITWSNSRDAYYYDWSLVGEFVCQLRLNCSLSNYQIEGTIDQTKAVSTGQRRNNNYDIDLSYKLTTYYFDDGANLACTPLFTSDGIIINGRSYINKTLYVPNIRTQSGVSLGEVEIYDQSFSQINKYGQLPQQIAANNPQANYYVIFNNAETDNVDVYIGTTGGGLTLVETIEPGQVFEILVTSLAANNYIQLVFTDADPSATMPVIIGVGTTSGYTRSTITANSGTAFGNVTYNQLLNNNYIAIVGTVNAVRPTAWRGLASSKFCVQAGGVNNGTSAFATLEQYYTDTNTATGTTKPNTSGDPDYIAPVTDSGCPVPVTFYQYLQNEGTYFASSALACGAATGGPFLYSATGDVSIDTGKQFYVDSGLTVKFVGNGQWYNILDFITNQRVSCQINSSGIVTATVIC